MPAAFSSSAPPSLIRPSVRPLAPGIRREHLPDAMKSFGAVKAWRYWSATDPSLHHAMYQ